MPAFDVVPSDRSTSAVGAARVKCASYTTTLHHIPTHRNSTSIHSGTLDEFVADSSAINTVQTTGATSVGINGCGCTAYGRTWILVEAVSILQRMLQYYSM
jgi:hypothetical protein